LKTAISSIKPMQERLEDRLPCVVSRWLIQISPLVPATGPLNWRRATMKPFKYQMLLPLVLP